MPSEQLSVFDIFKIGVGPSSSHTLGPWRAAQTFVKSLPLSQLQQLVGLKVLLYGSLAKTGVGHGTDMAILLGLLGEDPETVSVDTIIPTFSNLKTAQEIVIDRKFTVPFSYKNDILFLYSETLPEHPNGMTFQAFFKDETAISKTFFSIGGGFIVKQGEQSENSKPEVDLPFSSDKASDLLHWCMKTGLKISEVVWENELTWDKELTVNSKLENIYQVIKECVFRGAHTKGVLPGGLNVTRRAEKLNRTLIKNQSYNDFDTWITAIKNTGDDFGNILNWVSCFALAVNEENASFGRVVTAPTNGAAGVIPAVLLYFIIFCNGNNKSKIFQFMLVASEIGSIFKKGATISAAMGGCQAEIGVSSAMAAAALTECMGGSQRQVLMAAEIAMEHHLGLTCDPIGGLVQVPCIERNTMGAIKAITASQLALQSNPDDAKVSLDAVVNTMWQTALDMNSKYKETSEAGLAVNIPIMLPEC